MQVEIEVFENFFQKRRFNNEFYTRLTCLKDILVNCKSNFQFAGFTSGLQKALQD